MFSVKTPVVWAASTTSVAMPSPRVGLGSVAVGAYRTPRAVMLAPPLLVTLPPSVTDVGATLVAVGLVTVGATGSWTTPRKTVFVAAVARTIGVGLRLTPSSTMLTSEFALELVVVAN